MHFHCFANQRPRDESTCNFASFSYTSLCGVINCQILNCPASFLWSFAKRNSVLALDYQPRSTTTRVLYFSVPREPVFPPFATPFPWFAGIPTSVHLSNEMPPQRRSTKKKRRVLAVLIVTLAIYSRQRILQRRAREYEERTSTYEPPIACI